MKLPDRESREVSRRRPAPSWYPKRMLFKQRSAGDAGGKEDIEARFILMARATDDSNHDLGVILPQIEALGRDKLDKIELTTMF